MVFPLSTALSYSSTTLVFSALPVLFLFIPFLTLQYFHFRKSITKTIDHNDHDQPIRLPGWHLNAILPFFGRRYDFLRWGHHITRSPCYQFQLLNETVVVLAGENNRKAFLNAKGFDLTEGFKVLSGAKVLITGFVKIPMVKGVTSDLQTRRISLIHRRLASVQRAERLAHLLPLLLDDCRSVMFRWGNSGIFDPFVNVYELTFQTTIRSLSCTEISENAALVAKLKALYDRLDEGTTPATVLLPWLPSPSMLKKLWATKQIYDIIVQAIDDREQSGMKRDDTLQFLLDSGDDRLVVVGFILGLLVAGARATGTSASWLFTYLSSPGNSDWRKKARDEVESLLSLHSARYCDHFSTSSPFSASPCHVKSSGSPPSTGENSSSTSFSFSHALKSIPLEAWEHETPILDRVIKETLRLAQPHTAMRKNMGGDVYIEGRRVPEGAYVVYPFSDVHLDERLYENPWNWDPSRREPENVSHGSILWGAGNTICLGQRLARLELKVLTSMFLLGFEQVSLVDGAGNGLERPPRPNWNDTMLARPTEHFFMKYERNSGNGCNL